MTQIKTAKNENGTYDIYTPYNKKFVTSIKRIGGAKWNASARAWNIPAVGIEDARSATEECYGEADIPTEQEMVTIRVKFKDEYSELRGGIEAFGKTLARAWGRDSGAKVGDGVVLEAGEITSGGSMQNWKTIAKAGATFRLVVPENIYNKEKDEDEWDVEIVEDAKIDKRAALIAEREKLLARLAEIEKELA